MHSLGIIPASPVTTLAKGATVARAEYAREAAGRWRPLATIARRTFVGLLYIVAAVLAALKIAGLATAISWWMIAGIALAPLAIALTLILFGLALIFIASLSGNTRRLPPRQR